MGTGCPKIGHRRFGHRTARHPIISILHSTKETIQCTSGELTNAPDFFPEFVNLVDIRNNFIEFFSLKKINTLDVKYVYLSNNSIEQIEDLNRHSFPELEELDLSINKLTWLPMGMLRRMSMLQRLDLSFNSLVSLSTIRIPSSLRLVTDTGVINYFSVLRVFRETTLTTSQSVDFWIMLKILIFLTSGLFIFNYYPL